MATKKLNCPEVVPAWFKTAAPGARFNSKEVALLFGFKSANALASDHRNGDFPKPDEISASWITAAVRGTSVGSERSYWLKTTLAREILRRRRHNAELEENRGNRST